jgi:hypothetical protein
MKIHANKRVFFYLGGKNILEQPKRRRFFILNYLKYIFLIWLVFIISIQFTNVNIRITYYRERNNDELIIIVSTLLGLVNFKIETNLIDFVMSRSPGLEVKQEIEATGKGKLVKEIEQELDLEEVRSGVEKIMRLYKKYKGPICYFRSKIAVKELKWQTYLGTGDAALTGIFIGILWNIKTLILSVLDSQFKWLVAREVEIVPDFENINFGTNFDCILSFKIGHAIIAGIKGITAKLKDGEKGERTPN